MAGSALRGLGPLPTDTSHSHGGYGACNRKMAEYTQAKLELAERGVEISPWGLVVSHVVIVSYERSFR